MAKHNYIEQAFREHLANPEDPKASILMIRNSKATAEFLTDFIQSGMIATLKKSDKVQLLAMLGVWCPKMAPEICTAWMEFESDVEWIKILRMRISTFRK